LEEVMQAQPIPNPALSFSLQELEQIETTIQASERLLATLHGRREALGAELDRIMRPQAVVARVARKTIGPGLEYRGPAAAAVDRVPRAPRGDGGGNGRARGDAGLCGEDPRGALPRSDAGMGAAVQPDACRGLVRGHEPQPRALRRILPAAVRAAGLAWSQDVKAYWKATPAPE
jgi:hypothetical protein